MNSIYLTCNMRLRKEPSTASETLIVLEKNQIIEVEEIVPGSDGMLWFKVDGGYVANIDEVFYHSDSYSDSTALKAFIIGILDSSVQTTINTVNDIEKALDQF